MRKCCKLEYIHDMRPNIDEIIRKFVTYSHARKVKDKLLYERCKDCYWYRGWAGFINNTSFERLLHHLKKSEESVVTGRHSKEVFEGSIVSRPDLYQLVLEWCYNFVEMSVPYGQPVGVHVLCW